MKKKNVYNVENLLIDFQKYLNPEWDTFSTAQRNKAGVSSVFVCDQYLAYAKGRRDAYLHDFTLARLSEVVRNGKELMTF
jgi:hypothetical protein